ncbi:MAG: hypothetical protein J5693_04080 [Bacteroidales bacterium]|nr:hypothetical protein [Bacteroidales bacterium]
MKKIIVTAVLTLAAISATAQTFQQALFLDGYRLGYRYNPAFQNETGFLSVGQWENQTRNNFGASSFLYPRGEEIVTALHSSVTADEFLGSLSSDNYFSSNINFNLVSYGWRKDKAYHTLEANIRAVYGASIPKEIFAIAKLGTGETNYDLSGMRAWGNAVVELAYGYSYKFSDILSVGGRAKLLIGIEAINYNVSRFDLTMSEDVYRADVEADLDLTSRWNKVGTNEDGYMDFTRLSAKDRWRLPSGAGLAVDLGVTVTPCEGLTLSASALDLGGMLWYYGNAGVSQGTATFEGVKELSLDDIKNGNIKQQFKEVQDEFIHSVKVKPVDKHMAPEAIPFNLNVAAKYEMPFYRALAIGATGNYLGSGGIAYREARGVLAWNPCSWCGLAGNCGAGSYGPVWGFAANAAIRNFRLTAALSNGFGGTVPYSSTPLTANNKVFTVGLTYDL